ncbi:MAG TPA: hypothetical protein VFT55_16960 [Planctomycetota bacterium]|nr:hypothetical protein [Planctomycetota bacterium]
MRPSIRLATIILPAATFLAAAAAQKHPHYNDGGTLAWFTTFAAAKEAARNADKLIFMEVGAKT